MRRDAAGGGSESGIERYDAVIAGAGPAGGQCARDLAARGHDVLLLEAESEESFPSRSNKSTAGTFHSMLSSFNVPDDVIQHHTERVVLESPNEFYAQDHAGAVLDFAAFKRWLVAAARESGATVRFDARVSGAIVENGRCVGVEYAGGREVRAEVVVDATGPSAAVARDLEVTDLHRANQAIGVDYELEGIDLDHPGHADLTDAMMLRLDHDVAPGGYSWIFHTGDDTAKVGVCFVQNDRHTDRSIEGLTIDDYVERWLETDPRFADASRVEGGDVLRGSAHIQAPGQFYDDGFLAVGDVVPSIDPVWGEGINKGMRSGRAAATAADYCLAGDERAPTAETLSTYESLWHRDVAPNARARLLLTELLYLAPNDRLDVLMRDLRTLDVDTLASANEGSKLALAKLLRLRDAPYLLRWLRERIADPSNRWNPDADGRGWGRGLWS